MRHRQRGAMAVEVALAMPMLLGIGFIGADVHRIGITRTELEQRSGSAALTLAMQSRLTASGLQALEDVVTQDKPAQYQLAILNVLESGKVNWGFKRGGADDLCQIPVSGGRYTGELPEPLERDDSDTLAGDGSGFSYIVIRQCRSTSDIALTGGLALPDVLQITQVMRASALRPELDQRLTQENLATGLGFKDQT